jgi:hypothetical protein
MDGQIDSIIQENKARRELLMSPYDPVTGEGSPIARKVISFSAAGQQMCWGFPLAMYEENKVLLDAIEAHQSVEATMKFASQICDSYSVAIFMKDLMNMRFRHDFEFWAFSTVKIQDKQSKQMIPFRLNRPQRKALAIIEKMRRDRTPIRFIICKARQWGGSTLVQIYMAWMQIIQRTGWHSAIVTDVEDQARNIRGMFSKLAKNYPKVLGSIVFMPHEGSTKNRIIKDRGCIIGVGSVQKPDSLRSFDFAMTHMSEVSLWKSTAQKSAEDLAQTLRATVPDVPDSLAAVESSPKGVGNFFHREWLAAKEGKSSYVPIYVAWHEIEMYQKPVENYEVFIKWMLSDSYAMYLWNLGATLEGIKWYFDTKRGENYDDWRMKSEYSSDDIEAFQSTGARVFSQAYVELARRNNKDPEFIGDVFGSTNKGKTALDGVDFKVVDRGPMYVWGLPDKSINISNRYLVTVDIGGRTEKADYSVIRVIDRYWMSEGGKPEIVATWRGHIDQDLLAWKAAQISKLYNNALLVVESNSLNTEESEGNHFLTVLDEVVKYYPNIYARTEPDKVRQGLPIRYGFQTNMNTKPMVIDTLNGALREEAYIERDRRACDEMDTYEVKENGTYGAVEGCHDDIVMATAIGLWICFNYMPMPKEFTPSSGKGKNRIISEATI